MNEIEKLQRRKFFIPNLGRFFFNFLIFKLFPSELNNWMYHLLLSILIFSFLWFVLEILFFLDYRKNPFLVYFPFTFDIAIISILCYISGGVTSPFIFLYLLMVISDTIYSDTRLGFHAMVVSVICYLIIAGSTYFGFLEYTNLLNNQKYPLEIVYPVVGIFFIFSTIMMYFSIQEVMNQKKNLLGSLESEKSKLELSQKEIETLNEISKRVNDSSAIKEIMIVIADHVQREYGINICAVYMVNERSESIDNFYYRCPEIVSPEILQKIESIKFPLMNTDNVHSYVYQAKEESYTVKLVPSKNEDENFIRESIGFTSFLCMPLVLKQTVIGFLDFAISDRPMLLSQRDLDSFQKLSNQIAGAIFNSNLLVENEKARAQSEIEKGIALIAQKETEREKIKSESLLLNILPEEIAMELKDSGTLKPVFYPSATVLFTDFQGFTEFAEKLEPTKLISDLDYCFSKFDAVMGKYKLEKLKTIGDSYMCAGGIPKPNTTHSIDSVLAALEMLRIMNEWKLLKEKNFEDIWQIRIGIHSGPLIAGVIGQKKFAYDVWGDTVNLASRMESSGLIQTINISGDTYELVQEFFDCEYRGKISAKNKGEIDMFLVVGIKSKLCSNQNEPNSEFWNKYNNLS